MKNTLLLEDGSYFEGTGQDFKGERIGRVMINTAVVGYQEIMTDPANAGRIVVLTYPLIGNYGVSGKFNESARSFISGLVIKEESSVTSNWQAQDSFRNFLKKNKVPCASSMDTRTLAVKIRDKGEMYGILSSSGKGKNMLLAMLEKGLKTRKNDFIRAASTKRIIRLNAGSHGRHVAILDLGVTKSILKQLADLNCRISLLPYDTAAEKILSLKPDGLIVSGGPEADVSIPQVTKEIKKLAGKIRILGISLGHQAVCLALGARLKAMKVGHHGVNYPVKFPGSLKGEITVQNHSYTVEAGSLKNMKVTCYNVNDNTVEGASSEKLRIETVQYYPARPGSNEVNGVFIKFIKDINKGKGLKHA